jgi:hypothetical protein
VLLAICLVFLCRKEIVRRWSGLRQILIDAEYVLEERVDNYEPGKKKKVTFGEGTKVHDGDPDSDEDEDDVDGREDVVWEDVDEEVEVN